MKAADPDFDIIPFESGHLDASVGLFVSGYEAQRALVPSLPQRYAERAEVLPLLRSLVLSYPGVVALDRGAVVGYLAGMFLSNFKGEGRGVYCPEWGHAAVGPRRDEVYTAMYTSLCTAWLREGCVNQALTIFAGDHEVLDAWFWFGFGMVVVDAIRGMEPAEGPEEPQGGVVVRLAVPGDAEILLPLARELTRYHRDGPIFLHRTEPRDSAEILRLLSDPQIRLWIAQDPGGQAVGLIQGQLGAEDACQVARDPKTASITGAYVKAHVRRNGVGLALLRAAMAWAAETECTRVSVDFESANPPGRTFWLKHFQPICYSVLRHVDDRVIPRRRTIT
jgi:GNAT superfamily N-acetyltransferase